NSGEGIDSVHSSIGWTLSANVEELLLTGTADVDGTGNELANTLTGNSGDNALYGLGGNDTLKGGAGDDAMAGGTGNDIYYVDSAGDSVIENAGEGTDTVNSSLSFTLGGNVERLVLTGASAIDGTGNELANMLTGNAADNHLSGLAGNDSLQGGGGSDWLEGGSGRDVFMGGAGADQFVFRDGDFAALTSSGCDTVNDFSSAEGDKLDFQFVDADSTAAGDQAFTFLGTAAFDGHAGELRYEVINGNTYVQGDTNGDGHVDFMVRVIGDHAFTSGDFTL
ncbi:MAG: M10 family metallopeptidase C-terminal domain-containing protein, partial [Bacillota bacterium]